MGLSSSPYIGRVEKTKQPQPTFCVSAKFWLLSDLHERDPIAWTQRMLKSPSLGAIWNLCKRTGLP